MGRPGFSTPAEFRAKQCTLLDKVQNIENFVYENQECLLRKTRRSSWLVVQQQLDQEYADCHAELLETANACHSLLQLKTSEDMVNRHRSYIDSDCSQHDNIVPGCVSLSLRVSHLLHQAKKCGVHLQQETVSELSCQISALDQRSRDARHSIHLLSESLGEECKAYYATGRSSCGIYKTRDLAASIQQLIAHHLLANRILKQHLLETAQELEQDHMQLRHKRLSAYACVLQKGALGKRRAPWKNACHTTCPTAPPTARIEPEATQAMPAGKHDKHAEPKEQGEEDSETSLQGGENVEEDACHVEQVDGGVGERVASGECISEGLGPCQVSTTCQGEAGCIEDRAPASSPAGVEERSGRNGEGRDQAPWLPEEASSMCWEWSGCWPGAPTSSCTPAIPALASGFRVCAGGVEWGGDELEALGRVLRDCMGEGEGGAAAASSAAPSSEEQVVERMRARLPWRTPHQLKEIWAWHREVRRLRNDLVQLHRGWGEDSATFAAAAKAALRESSLETLRHAEAAAWRVEREISGAKHAQCCQDAQERRAALLEQRAHQRVGELLEAAEKREAQRAQLERYRARVTQLLAQHRQALQAKKEAEQARAAEEGARREEEAAREAAANKRRVQHRRRLDAERSAQREEAERAREGRRGRQAAALMKLRAEVAPAVERDFQRATGHTAASRAAPPRRRSVGAAFRELFGFTTDDIVKDQRFKVFEALRGLNLHSFEYAREVVAQARPAKPTRPDNLTSLQVQLGLG